MSNRDILHKDSFKEFWKAKLSAPELKNVRRQLKDLKRKGLDEHDMVNVLSRNRKKLKEDWKSERVVRTETKRFETQNTRKQALKEGINYFKIVLDPRACDTCKRFSRNGTRIFSRDELIKDGRLTPPHHPSCRCILLPYIKNKK
jgi:SPP1 gp7 family putative phage head morphogenesis protein